MKETRQVTGKQVLLDAAMLAKDAGLFLYDLGKRIYLSLKAALGCNDDRSEQCSAD